MTAASAASDIIAIQRGVYENDVATIDHPLHIVGDGPDTAIALGAEIIYVVGLTTLQASDFAIG